MSLYAAWGFILTAMGLLAMWLVPKRPKLGWSIGIASEVVWLAFALATDQPGFVIGAVLYGIVYGRNLWKCCRKPSQRERGKRMRLRWKKRKADPYAELKVPLKYNYGSATVTGQPKKAEGLTLSSVDAVLKQEYSSIMQDILNDTNRILWGPKEEPLSEYEIRKLRRLIAKLDEEDAAKRAEEAAVRKAERHAKKVKKAKKLLADERKKAYNSKKTKESTNG